MSSVAFMIKQGGSLVVFINGKPYTVDSSSLNYNAIVSALEKGDHQNLLTLLDIRKSIADFSKGKLEVYDNDVYWNKKPITGKLQQRLLELVKKEYLLDPFINFLEKLEKNPEESSRNELFEFMEVNDLPLTPDGDFIAYKAVSPDYMDLHTKTIYNGVGETVSMNRDEVVLDRNRPCDAGLHVASYDYFNCERGFVNGSNHLMACKINPQDVVSIPLQYGNKKMRVCKYVVVDELKEFKDSLQPLYTEDYQSWYSYDEPYVDNYDGWKASDEQVEDLKEYVEASKDKLVVKKTSKSTKLDEASVRAIKAELDDGWYSIAEIARMHNISPRQVGRIRDGQIWAHVK